MNAITRIRRQARRGFTLVEILIVVIILGILAAIVIPQFTNASNDARKANVVSQLQTLRAQIELYKLQHKEALPALLSTGWTVFTEYTDINGTVSATKDATHIYGPYYQTPPSNPLTPAGTASVVGADATASPGWCYDEGTLPAAPGTGKVCATGTDSTKYFKEDDGTDTATRPW
jgi:general secretion pathway protein G